MKRKPVRTKTLSSAERIARQGKSLTSGETNAAPPLGPGFQEVLALIQRARERAYQAVNTGLIDLYWQVGEYISRKLQVAEWGEKVVGQLARYIQRRMPNLRGFSRPNLFRMKSFYEAYSADAIVSPLVRQLPWTIHLILISQCKRREEREFYMRLNEGLAHAVASEWRVAESSRRDFLKIARRFNAGIASGWH